MNVDNKYRNWIFVITLLLCLPLAAQVKNKKDLESKKKKLQDEINYTNKLLNETRASKKTSMKELVTLKNQIGQREQMINTLQDEVGLLDNQIAINQQSYDSLQTQLNKLKKEYAKVITYTYKNRNNNSTLGYVLAGKDFNAAYRRAKYTAMYAAYRKEQAKKIGLLQSQISSLNNEIVTDRQSKITVLSQNQKEKQELAKDKKEQEKIVVNLQKTEANLKAQLAKKKNEAAKLNSAINTIIENDIKASKAKAAKTTTTAKTGTGSKGSTTTPVAPKAKENEITLTPEGKLTSQGFENNRGRLPWPVEKGFISSTFGTHPHPVLKGITINNNGVDISTDKGATARALYDGEVSGVVSIPGAGQAVIIRHGEYLTVYSNLGSVSVSIGSKVKAKQSIGSVGEGDNGPELHLEIWKNKTKLNPSLWIVPR